MLIEICTRNQSSKKQNSRPFEHKAYTKYAYPVELPFWFEFYEKVVVYDVVFKPWFGLGRIGAYALGGLGAFLHTNEVSSLILIWIRFTNKRHSSTMNTKTLPGFAC